MTKRPIFTNLKEYKQNITKVSQNLKDSDIDSKDGTVSYPSPDKYSQLF